MCMIIKGCGYGIVEAYADDCRLSPVLFMRERNEGYIGLAIYQ